ncbi:hypothetical protein CAPTEDRAFT_18492 [Capitella teleta]|uniref:Phosphoribosyltransferase domain-containing protein n=1 Tax=Capitella teleta TaxID=283909 RepID=R7UKN3_CAPTE|nr:hypothetical protein CAPTEDRAFT_18492 [Capitella teleta]|eukprot:ELU04358.1 hypothetical protein CAPTEDRAFT_18492 [Capitella teleta]
MRVRRTVEFRQKIRWDRFKDGFPNLFIEDTLATLLSGTPFTSRGPSQVMIFDIHALQERFYFSDTVIPRLESAIPLLQIELAKLQGPIAIAFPDEGAFKRFHSMFPEDSNVIVCTKIRDGRKRYVKIRDGNVTGNHVVIVDDLVQTGGTLIECAKVLLAGGASKISAYVTHPVFPAESWRKFTDHKDVAFDSFWITDSVPHATSIAQHAPFKLLSLSTAIASILLGYDLRQV